MIRILFTRACLAALATALWTAGSIADEPAADPLKPFVGRYCVSCHGDDDPKGDRDFTLLRGDISDDDSLVDHQDILDLLNLGEMPPPDAPQPTVDERRQLIAWLTERIASYHDSQQDNRGDTVLRRLNAREYRNTIRDLVKLDVSMFDPTSSFPRDQSVHHLDNIGESLVTSAHLLSGYLQASQQVIDKALWPLEQPPVQQWSFRDGFRQQPEIDQVHRKTNGFAHLTLYDVVGADKPEGAYGPIHAFAEGVPFDGTYELRIRAEAVNRLHPYEDDFLGTDRTEPLRLGIVAGNHEAGELHLPQPIEPLLAEIDLADKPQWYTVRVHLDAGFTPRFTFRNGLLDARNLWGRLIKRYPDRFESGLKGIVDLRFHAIKYGELPQIHIHEIEIEGPLYDQWPRPSQRVLLGEQFAAAVAGQWSEEDIRQRLQQFATLAYRRPASDDEVEHLMQVVKARQAAGRTLLEAYADALQAVLCSPSFLYLAEPGQQSLDAYGLATRLSYLLWSSMPDAPLIELAANGQLDDPQVLRQQVRRMLADPRSDALVQGFLGSWLGLRELGSAPPDRNAFRDFYQYDLDAAMRRESELFMRHLIDQNLSITNFLDSDFTFVNKPLARLYGIDPPEEPGFQRVTLTDRRRGGLLGQASVLTVTANGIDTSPVVRGVWILDNLLGTPPSPPPPDVEPLDPDVRGATSIREQLEKHRQMATCNDCHRKIDPPGFALESFDPIGRWRDRYDRNVKVDPSGELSDGQSFEDVRGLKQILVGRKSQFARALTEKMLAYATGRLIVPSDRPYVEQILSRVETSGDGMRDLIEEIVLSEPFQSP